MTDLAVAIIARNEAKSIYKCLSSIRRGIAELADSPKVYICLNNCTDGTESEVYRFLKDTSFKAKVLKLHGTLLEVQSYIHETAKTRLILFSDGDIEVDKYAIKELLSAMQDSNVVAANGRTVLRPISRSPNLVEKIHIIFMSQKLLTARHYLHGRFFITKVFKAPTADEVKIRSAARPNLYRNYGGIKVDDVYLSAYILSEFGRGAIKEIASATIYHPPNKSWQAWLRAYRRAAIDKTKLFAWFPEFKPVKPLLKRRTNIKAWFKAPLHEKILWIIFKAWSAWAVSRVKAELILSRFLSLKFMEQWPSKVHK